MQKLQKLLPGDPITTISGADTIIVDDNAVVQTLSFPNVSEKGILYSDMAASFLRHVMYISRSTCAERLFQIHIVFDQHFEQSFINNAREMRMSWLKTNIHHVLLNGT